MTLSHAIQIAATELNESTLLHSLRVMQMVPTRLRIAAVLHDVVEDTRISHSDLTAKGLTSVDSRLVWAPFFSQAIRQSGIVR